MIINLHLTSRKIWRKKTQTNNITRSPDTNMPESTWEYKITNNNNKYIHLYIIFISCEFLEGVWEIMRHPRYCLAHHPCIPFNFTSAINFSTPPTPPTPPTLAHQPPYPRWHTRNCHSLIIMNEVFNFQENEDRI